MNQYFGRGRLFRGLLALTIAACVSVGATATASAAPPDCKGRGVPVSKISIQLWTFAEYIGFGTDAATIARTREVFDALSDMGYRNVEPFTLSGLSAEDYRALLDKYGLKASARHVDIGTPEDPADIDQIIADNRTLGIKYFGSGSTPIFPPIYTTEAEWIAYAEYLDELGAQARKAGQTLMVHNHDIEFEEIFDDQTVFDILAGEHRSAERRLPARPVLGRRTAVARPARRHRAVRQPDPAVPRQGHGGRPVPRADRDRRRGDHRLPVDLRRRRGSTRYYVVEHDPRFGDPDVRPVRGSREGLRLPRLRDLLSHSRVGWPSSGRPAVLLRTLQPLRRRPRAKTARALAALAGAIAHAPFPSAAAAQTPPPDSQFQKVVIDATPGEPIDLAVLPDGSVLHTERIGEVWLHDADNGLKTLAAKLDVYSHDEEGLQSIALDPNFEENGWIYLYYSPPLNTPVDDPATPTINEGDAPEFGTPARVRRLQGLHPALALPVDRRLDRPRLRAADPPGPGRSRHLLPRRRRHRLRRERQPAALDR